MPISILRINRMKGKLKLIMDSNGEIDLENYSPESDFFV